MHRLTEIIITTKQTTRFALNTETLISIFTNEVVMIIVRGALRMRILTT